MKLIYNELSAIPLSANKDKANEKIKNFIDTFTIARDKNFKKIRFSVLLEDIELTQDYSIKDWLINTDLRNLKNILLSAREYPEWDQEDTWFENEYIKSYFYFKQENEAPESKCLGLASAHIYDTLSIGFGDSIWKKNIITIIKRNEETQEEVSVDIKNVFSENCMKNAMISEYIDSIKDIALEEANISPAQKNIHFRDDHGTDILKAHADRLVNSPYVISVINSLPWKSQEINYIKKTFSNGIVHIRLHWTQQGLGMAIQTTGRNLRETNEIAVILKEKYDD